MSNGSADQISQTRRAHWRVFGVLMLGAVLGAVALLPYTLAVLSRPPAPPGPLPLALLVVASVVQTVVLTGIAAGLGLWLGDRVGLGAPLLRDWLGGDPTAPWRFVASLPLASALGVLVAVVIFAVELLVYAPRIAVLQAAARSTPSEGVGILSALYGAIDEEILLRLGLMTVLVWVITRVTRTSTSSGWQFWAANFISALLFGLGHPPATSVLLPLTPLVVSRAVLLNGLAGVVFGWLYWRRGLLSAMAAHFASDVVLHVIAPALIQVGVA